MVHPVAFRQGNLNEELKGNFLLKCHQGLSGCRWMVWNTGSAGVWRRTLQALNNVTLLITSCECMLSSAKIFEGFCQGWEDPNLTCSGNKVCFNASAVLIPHAMRVWCSEHGRCSLLLTRWQQAQKAALLCDCFGALKQPLLHACPSGYLVG